MIIKVLLDSWCNTLVESLKNTALAIMFSLSSTRSKVVTGWNEYVTKFRDAAQFWQEVWIEAGCPSAGVLFQIKHRAKIRYKYGVRCI